MRSFRRRLSALTAIILAVVFASYKYLQLETNSVTRAESFGVVDRSRHHDHDEDDSSLHVNLTESQRRHFFDCDHPESPCVYFRLKDFLEQQGIAFNQTWGSQNRNLPAITSLNYRATTETLTTKASDMPNRFSFVHFHKCGGSTVKAIFQARRKELVEKRHFEVDIETYQSSFGWSTPQQIIHNEELRQEHIGSLLMTTDRSSEHVVFSIVRDPVDRFVSAIQQVMHYHDHLRAECLLPTARATIQCTLLYLQTHPSDDVHFVPMLAHLRLLHGVPVRLFSLQHLNLLSHYFIGRSLHVRDRSHPLTATSQVLSQMSSRDCSDEMLRAICDLYAVDVVMLKSLGMASEYCS